MQTIVITGSSKGIGLGLATEFLKRDCNVVLSARTASVLEQAAAQLAEAFGAERVLARCCDVTDFASVQALWEGAAARFGSVDVWINNAGMSHPSLMLWELDQEYIAPMVATNLTGTIFGCKVALQGMMQQGSGQIYNMEGHGSNDMITAGMTSYGATKRAVTYFTDSLQEEAKSLSVKICTMSPGMVMTDLLLKELHKMPAERRETAKMIYNILGDTVETVTPFLAEGVLNNTQTGAKITWLTDEKAQARFEDEAYLERDLLGQFGF